MKTMTSTNCLTKFHSAKIKRGVMRLLLSLIFIFFTILAQADIVKKPSVERLVNDFANVLSNERTTALEDSLNRYARRTSTQVTIVTVNDLDGHDVAEYAYSIGQTWGIGQKGKNNGVVILVKPKLNDNDRGRAFIAPGYGLEGVLPDITCSHIVNEAMIPYFRQNDYASGIIAGAIAVMKACEGEYEGEEYNDDAAASVVAIIVLIILILVIISIIKGDKNGGHGRHISFGDSWSDAAVLSSILRNSNSGWGSFSGGGGSFGGGFGGFGGGSFGGGGGGGSW